MVTFLEIPVMTLNNCYRQCAEQIVDLLHITQIADRELVFNIALKLFSHKFYQNYRYTAFWLNDINALMDYLTIDRHLPRMLEIIICAIHWRLRNLYRLRRKIQDGSIDEAITDALDEIAQRWLCDSEVPLKPNSRMIWSFRSDPD